MKYILFAWYSHGACGGMNDLVKRSDSIEELEKYFRENYTFYHEGHIVNAKSLRVEKEL